jgi:hypothetical protein
MAGKMHDFRVFKESDMYITPKACITINSGCQGLQKMHPNTELPKSLFKSF